MVKKLILGWTWIQKCFRDLVYSYTDVHKNIMSRILNLLLVLVSIINMGITLVIVVPIANIISIIFKDKDITLTKVDVENLDKCKTWKEVKNHYFTNKKRA